MKIKYAMILSAGLGKRMQPITLKTPKPLIEVEGKNLLERTINLLISYGIERNYYKCSPFGKSNNKFYK